MAKKNTVSKIEIRTASELKSECQRYLKEAIAEVLLDCQETLVLAQDELKHQKELLKKYKEIEKTAGQQLAKAKEALAKKTTKAAQNKVKVGTTKFKDAVKSLNQITKNMALLQKEIIGIKAYQKKEKAFKSAFLAFEKNYQASLVASPVQKKSDQSTQAPAPVVAEPTKAAPAIVDVALKPGQKAPAFKVKNEQGEWVSLTDFAGKKVVLYFYPKDDTPGCTAQAHDFTYHAESFEKNNTVIIGVSRDNEVSHQRFKEKYNINFDLLADTDEQLCQDYGVIKMKNLYGKEVRGIERSTFLIDENGVLVHIWRKVKVADHVTTVLAKTEQPAITLV